MKTERQLYLIKLIRKVVATMYAEKLLETHEASEVAQILNKLQGRVMAG